MLDQFKQHIKKIVPSGSKLLVAVSGGVDSIVLCELLKKTKIHFSIAHVNYELRGDQSEKDELFLDKYCLCLLYTSPSPRDRTRSRMPSSA